VGCLAAETNVSSTKTNDRQRHYIGCILSSVQGTTCLKFKIVRIHLIGEFEEFAWDNNNFENLSASSNFCKYRSSQDNFDHYFNLRSQEAPEAVFINNGVVHIFRAENGDAEFVLRQFSYWMSSIKMNQGKNLSMELQVSIGRLFYDKRRIFGVNDSFQFQPNQQVPKFIPTVITSNPTS
jgi:hypothetical protein